VGGWTALEMAKLGAARSVVALSPAGLWARRMPLYEVLSLRGTRSCAGSSTLSCRPCSRVRWGAG
jgi:hypothetical protein